MNKNKHIIIVASDSLQGYGLKSLLEEYFNLEKFSLYINPEESDINLSKCDLLFIHADFYFPLYNKLAPIKNKVVILLDKQSTSLAEFSSLNIRQEQNLLLDNLHKLCTEKLSQRNNHHSNDNKSDISDREIDVLTLIAKGYMNKNIADELNISINTVLTHRKNLTAKLGIKTVSGITMYAILNGLISADDIQ